MNVTPGSAFLKTVPGSTGHAAPRATPSTSAALQAQSTEAGRRAENAATRQDAPARPGPAPFGPRGSIIDIIA